MIQWHVYAETKLEPYPGRNYMEYTPFPPPMERRADPGDAKWDSGLIETLTFPIWENVHTNATNP
jgi:hypothetical protein